jgi:SET domain-containing protein
LLRVKTSIRPSPIDGIGLFADQFIPEGTVTWVYDPLFDNAYSEEQIRALPEFAQEQFITYAFWDHAQEKYILCADNQRFINHSSRPNISSAPHEDRALRDISIGEELTCDYAAYEHDWFERRTKDRSHFTVPTDGRND